MKFQLPSSFCVSEDCSPSMKVSLLAPGIALKSSISFYCVSYILPLSVCVRKKLLGKVLLTFPWMLVFCGEATPCF